MIGYGDAVVGKINGRNTMIGHRIP